VKLLAVAYRISCRIAGPSSTKWTRAAESLATTCGAVLGWDARLFAPQPKDRAVKTGKIAGSRIGPIYVDRPPLPITIHR
jgi:hypothetical protein